MKVQEVRFGENAIECILGAQTGSYRGNFTYMAHEFPKVRSRMHVIFIKALLSKMPCQPKISAAKPLRICRTALEAETWGVPTEKVTLVALNYLGLYYIGFVKGRA